MTRPREALVSPAARAVLSAQLRRLAALEQTEVYQEMLAAATARVVAEGGVGTERTCASCGAIFIARTPGHRVCQKDCKRRQAAARSGPGSPSRPVGDWAI